VEDPGDAAEELSYELDGDGEDLEDGESEDEDDGK
jgi:hypothetical protein